MSQRGSSRLRLKARATLTTWRGRQFVEITDLSQTGAQLVLSSTHAFDDGTLCWNGNEAAGKVIWREHRACGFRFDHELPLTALLGARATEAA